LKVPPLPDTSLLYWEIFIEDELFCEEEETTCEADEPPPEPDEETLEEIRPFSYVRFKVPPLICCTERVLGSALKSICRLPPAPSLRISHCRRSPSSS
jgi:hypothetical protein